MRYNLPSNGWSKAILPLLSCGLALWAATVEAEEPAPNLEVHEWSVWLTEPGAKQINAVEEYKSAMPGMVDSDRARRETDKPSPSPLSLMTLYGEPPEVADIDVRITAGRPVAHWPRSEGKASRLRWLDVKLTKDISDKSRLAYVPPGHWFHQARELGGLYLNLKNGGRVERFLTYDLELQTTLQVRLDGGPDKFKVVNTGKFPLTDIMLMVPGDKGRRFGWVDKVGPAPAGAAQPAGNQQPGQPAAAPAGVAVKAAAPIAVPAAPVAAVAAAAPANNPPGGNQPGAKPAQSAAQPAAPETSAELVLGDPLAPESPDFKKGTTDELRRRLTAAELKEPEINLILSLYAKHIFEADEMLLLFRWPSEALDEMIPLAIEPDTAKIRRVGLVVARKVDPRLREDVQKLVLELGDPSYPKREQAEKRLTELGRLALPNLKEALKNTDVEIVVRAERILLGQKEAFPAE